MATFFDQYFHEQYKRWLAYTSQPGAVVPTDAAVQATYQTGNFPGHVGVGGPPAVPAPTNLGRVLRDFARPPLAPGPTARETAATAPVPGLLGPGNPANWAGVKLLGFGSFGDVALWEYNGPLPAPQHNKIAIKTGDITVPNNSLQNEGQFMRYLKQNGSQHIVELLLAPPPAITPAQRIAQGLPVGWTGRVRRLVMEYCPQGSLQRLIQMRRDRNYRFEELTLWRLFECLIDGCIVMEHNAEADLTAGPAPVASAPALSAANLAPAMPPGPGDRGVVLHLDLKPQNIMSANRNLSHPDTPVLKIGDLGFARYIDRNPANVVPPADFDSCQRLRRGTDGYFPPETFTRRWNFMGYATDPVCGKYGTATNLWGIGCIMYQMACFNKGTPEPNTPFIATGLPGGLSIHGAAGSGVLYGTHLEATAYSKLLKDTIHECLYEIPAHRPNLIVLKNRCLAQIRFLLAMVPPTVPEPWPNLDCPEPLTPAQALLFPEALTQCTYFGIIGRIGPARRCNHFELRRANQTNNRCKDHWDLGRY